MNDSTNFSPTLKRDRAPGNARRRFRLTGPSRPFDPATQAIRPDLADVTEADHHFAPHYAEPVVWIARHDVAVHAAASPDSALIDSVKADGQFAVLDVIGGWAWGRSVATHRVGYVAADALRPDGVAG